MVTRYTIRQIKKVCFSIIVLIPLLVSTGNTAPGIRLEKDIPINSLSATPNNITLNIYDSATAVTPIASQVFTPGQWSADFQFLKYTTVTESIIRFKVDFTNTDVLTNNMDLWIEIAIDGTIYGIREQVKKEVWALFSEEAYNAEDVFDKNINPKSISIPGYGAVINSSGQWIGDPTGLVGPQGPAGQQGLQGIPGPQGVQGPQGTSGGITVESDPTVPASIKDGIDWYEISNRPSGLDNGDDVGGIASETDPQVGENATNYVSKWNGSALISGAIYDNGRVSIGINDPKEAILRVHDNAHTSFIDISSGNPGPYDYAGIRIWDTDTTWNSGHRYWGIWHRYDNNHDFQINEYLGGSGAHNEALTIKSNSGNVGIGTRNPGSYKLYVNGSSYSSGGWSSSDIKFKKNIEPLSNVLEKLLKLRGVKFDWRLEEFEDKNFSTGKQIGIIAQELEEKFPELVNTDTEGYKSITYEKLTAVLLEAIKEQQSQLIELKSRIEVLEKK